MTPRRHCGARRVRGGSFGAARSWARGDPRSRVAKQGARDRVRGRPPPNSTRSTKRTWRVYRTRISTCFSPRRRMSRRKVRTIEPPARMRPRPPRPTPEAPSAPARTLSARRSATGTTPREARVRVGSSVRTFRRRLRGEKTPGTEPTLRDRDAGLPRRFARLPPGTPSRPRLPFSKCPLLS